ncbi:P-loop NTPase fold protein [Amycolatopsis sp. NPDC004169]|uniref:P-loop NTPase fold protein n=1 Tax=Amycolatopsis sp. NPDC004169 TaxID=3154453 RepID=UPI0033B57AE6
MLRAFDEVGLSLPTAQDNDSVQGFIAVPAPEDIGVLVGRLPEALARAYRTGTRSRRSGVVVAIHIEDNTDQPDALMAWLSAAGEPHTTAGGLTVIVSAATFRLAWARDESAWLSVEIGNGAAAGWLSASESVPPWEDLRGLPFGAPLTGHQSRVWWGRWGVADGRPVLATGGDDERVQLWDPRTGEAMILSGHTDSVSWGKWGEIDGEPVLATGSHDSTVILWNPVTGTAIGSPLTGHNGQVSWGAWAEFDGRSLLATGSSTGSVRLWDSGTPSRHSPLQSHSSGLLWGAWGRVDGQPVLATGGDYQFVRLWFRDAGSDPVSVDLGAAVRWGAWGPEPDSPTLAVGDESGAVTLWRPGGATLRRVAVEGPSWWGAWTTAAGLPILATGGEDGKVVLIEGETGGLFATLSGHTSAVRCGAWARIGGRLVLATGDAGGTVRLWDPFAHAEIAKPFTRQTHAVLWMDWQSVDGKPVLATGGSESTVRLWEVVTDRPVPRLPSYQSDAAHTVDELFRDIDATALAELITARTARPPLAVGLFGDWGAGKSHFLSLLWQEVDATARSGNSLAHSAVRQIRFNAWHYAETDLWASLVAELFAQLASPPDGDVPAEQRRHSRLTAELVAEHGVRARHQAARARHEALRQQLAKAERDDQGSWAGLSDEQLAELRNLAGERAESVYRDATRTIAFARDNTKRWQRFLRSLRPVTWMTLVGGLVATVSVLFLLPVVAALPAVSTVVGVLVALRATAKDRAAPAWSFAARAAEAQRERLRTAVDVAAAEVAKLAREEQNLTAAGQLAGLVTDRVKDSDYRGRLGVMTRIREDFHRMAALLMQSADDEEEADRDEAGDTLPRIDRIIIYIDDLDRCPPRRVVETLEAIHLLLAVDLFVVVVAVDPRWLLRAIGSHYRGLFDEPGADPDDEALRQSSPAQYLEKIFQVVLTLPPMETVGYQRLLRTLVGTRASQPSAVGREQATRAVTVPPRAEAAVDDRGLPAAGAAMPAARPVERVDPLTLEPEELTLLDILGPPLLVATPRAVKRLTNSYGLLTAIRREHRHTDLAETTVDGVVFRPYRAGLVLLAALVAYPALGPAFLVHLHHTAAERPGMSWPEFLDALRPVQTTVWENPAEPVMKHARAQQWQAMLDGLRTAGEEAARRNLPLAEPIGAWAEWVVPVGRLSFPAGEIVSALDRQRPLG